MKETTNAEKDSKPAPIGKPTEIISDHEILLRIRSKTYEPKIYIARINNKSLIAAIKMSLIGIVTNSNTWNV